MSTEGDISMEAADESRIRALSELLRAKRSQLQSFAWRCLSVRGARPQIADVQDALAEAYLRAATRLKNQPELAPDNLEAWFRRVLFFTCVKHADARYKLGLSTTIEELQAEDAVLEPAVWEQILAGQLLAKLDPQEGDILRMAAEGYTSVEIGQKYGRPADTIRQAKSRAISRLRRGIKGGFR
jgi:RNA polymerase sigma factor (sigma-70 family)